MSFLTKFEYFILTKLVKNEILYHKPSFLQKHTQNAHIPRIAPGDGGGITDLVRAPPPLLGTPRRPGIRSANVGAGKF